ncbi:MAG TPA: 2-oxoacid:acceptor oxidoreductase family protein [Patescibacteria group bacterium]|nr:2-oxoacid:acceptor oxidoreductase family protein [Patescibacteria group bacterium]
MTTKILIAGDGGQGVQTIADIIGQAAFGNEKFVSVIPNYGLEQRGGVSLSYLKISSEMIVYPKFQTPDLLVIMSEQADARTKDYQKKGVKILRFKDYQELLSKEGVLATSLNLFMLGVLVEILGERVVKVKDIEKLLLAKFSSKPNWPQNLKAFKIGLKVK